MGKRRERKEAVLTGKYDSKDNKSTNQVSFILLRVTIPDRRKERGQCQSNVDSRMRKGRTEKWIVNLLSATVTTTTTAITRRIGNDKGDTCNSTARSHIGLDSSLEVLNAEALGV